MELIDTHLHVIDTQKLSYPWFADGGPLSRDHLISEWHTQAKQVGITAALHVEVDVAEIDIEAETSMVESLMAEPNAVVKGAISNCRPERTDFAAFLERAISRPAIKGLRRLLFNMPDELSQATLFRENIKRLGATSLPFDLCIVPRQLPLAASLADLAPDVQFVLDHCGMRDIKGVGFAGWAPGLREIAKRPNVAVKISGISAYADSNTWALDDLRPFIDHCTKCFGFDRMVWGGDWPFVTQGSSLPLWVAATHSLVAGTTTEEKERLFSKNAKRIWKL